MSCFTDVVLLVTLFDEDRVNANSAPSNIEVFNNWLKEEWPSSQPQLERAAVTGVWAGSINMAADGSDLVEKFREIPWFEPSAALLMLRKEGRDIWDIYKTLE